MIGSAVIHFEGRKVPHGKTEEGFVLNEDDGSAQARQVRFLSRDVLRR